MSNPNKTARTALRWTHLLAGWLIGVFVYTPARESEAFVLLMQAAVVPAVVFTGLWMWQQARMRPLTTGMSDYLVRGIEAAEKVLVRSNTRVTGGGGGGRPEHLTLEDALSGSTETVSAAALFVLIGAEPRTGWLPAEIERGEKGFIATGQDLTRERVTPAGLRPERPPLLLETSMPGVFAVGDVRDRSVKRVASAVGEGSITIQQVHDYLSRV